MKTIIVILSILILLVGCSSTNNMSRKEKSAAYADYIKNHNLESINSIRTFRFDGWHSLSNDYLLISTSFKNRYLIEIQGYCPDIPFAFALVLDQQMSSTLSTRTDSIAAAASPRDSCIIKTIHQVTKEQAKELSTIGKHTEDE